MAAWTLRRFSCPAILQQIKRDHLLTFLQPHQQFFHASGITLPRSGESGPFDYHALAQLLLSPREKMPDELVHALYCLDEMATDEAMDALLKEMECRRLPLEGSDHSPADVAVQVWLQDPALLERHHAVAYLEKVRSFEYYQVACEKPPEFRLPSDSQLKALASELDDEFERKKRGRGSRVIAGDQDEDAWFLIGHPEPFRREESLDGVEPSSVGFRPLRYDVLVYSPRRGELRINAHPNWAKDLYCRTFGKCLFGNEHIFPSADKYTLDPLRRDGRAALACTDIEGIDWVKLREVRFYFCGNPWEEVNRKSSDVFAVFESRGKPFPEGGRISRASFQIKFSDCPRPRTVVVKPSNVAQFTRDNDSVLVERWLLARGFIRERRDDDGEEPQPILVED